MSPRTLFVLALVATLAACSAASPTTPTSSLLPTNPAIAPTQRGTSAPAAPTPTLVAPAAPAALARLGGGIQIDGSSTVFPITEGAVIAFQQLAPGVELRLGVSGTGGGFKKFCAGEILITGASRPIKRSEADSCAAAAISFVELPIAYDGLSVVVHPSNDWVTCLTLDELRRIWEPAAEGTLVRWSDLRPDWPDQPLSLYGAGTDSGTYDYFTAAVVGTEGVSRRDYMASEDDYLIAQDLAEDPDGLGFFGYSYYVEYGERLRALAIDGGAGCVAPSAQSIADGSYQPLARPIFIYVRADALDRPELRAFVEFYLANGPALAQRARAIPLPPRAYTLAAQRVDQRIIGSVFAGGAQVGVSIEQLLELEGP